MKLETVENVFLDQLADLRSAERQLVEALPRVAQAASSKKLRDAIEVHLEQIRRFRCRLEQVFQLGGMVAPSEGCEDIVVMESIEVGEVAAHA